MTALASSGDPEAFPDQGLEQRANGPGAAGALLTA